MSRKIKILSLVLVVLLLSTGCWDRIEINDRLFVLAEGIDIYKPSESDVKEENKPKKDEKNRYNFTYLLPSFSAIKEGNPAGKAANIVYESVGKSSYQGMRHLAERTNSQPYFQHMKAVVLGKDVVKNPDYLLEQLDAMERQDEMSRKIHVYVAKDKAEEVLKTGLSTTNLGLALQGMGNENRAVATYIPKTLEEAITEVLTGSALIPKISSSSTEIKISGSAIIKNQRFIGWLEDIDTRSVALMTGKAKRDIVQIDERENDIVYIISNTGVKKDARVEDGKIKIDINVLTEGAIQQYKVNSYPRLDNQEYIKKLEHLIKSNIKNQLDKTVNLLQNELETDVLKIDSYLKAHKSDIWKQVEKDWEEIFPNIEINVQVDSRIRRIGAVK